jgi:glyoxylase-like metal-dependent hydrolase (beta-lactamase superfamily II)
MKTPHCLVALLLTLLLPGPIPAQDMEDVEIRTVPVAEGIHMLLGRGGNIGVVSGPDGVFLIDDQYAPLTEKILAAVKAIDPGPVRFLVNTHWHGDHTGGNENLGKAGVVIVAHENVRLRMSVKQVMAALGREVPPSPRAALPVITFPDSLAFHLNGVTIEVQHVSAAHTDGDAVLWFSGRNAVHMGDIYFNGMYPFIDTGSGGSVAGTIAAAAAVLARADDRTKIIPGHGPLSDRAGLAAYRDMLASVRDRVQAGLAAGQSAEEIVASRPTADLDATWARGFLKPDDFVGIVAADLGR